MIEHKPIFIKNIYFILFEIEIIERKEKGREGTRVFVKVKRSDFFVNRKKGIVNKTWGREGSCRG